MKKTPKTIDSFTASNGFVIEYAPDIVVEDSDLQDSKFTSVKELLPAEFFVAAKELKQAKRIGRPPLQNPKQRVSLRLDANIVAALRARGKGWQTIANAALREWVATNPAY